MVRADGKGRSGNGVDLAGHEVLKNLYTSYSLRHFYASMLIAKNVDLKTIQERMGHQDAAMTLNVYGHLIRQKQADSPLARSELA